MILLHGLSDNRLGMIGYAELLLSHGFSVVMPDARAHGTSGSQLATYGLLESGIFTAGLIGCDRTNIRAASSVSGSPWARHNSYNRCKPSRASVQLLRNRLFRVFAKLPDAITFLSGAAEAGRPSEQKQ